MLGAVILLPLAVGAGLWPLGVAKQRTGAAVGRRLGVVAGATVTLTVVLAVAAAAGDRGVTLAWGSGLTLELAARGVAGVMAVLVPVVAAPVIVYASVHEDEAGLPRLLGLMTVFVASMELLVLAGDLLTLLIAWELVGALSWALIGADWRDVDNPKRAAHAFNATRFGGIGLFLAAGAAFAGTGSLAYADLGGLSGSRLSVVAAGAYVLIRLEDVLAPTGWFGPATIAVGLTTALAGGLVAAVEHHGKRVLAASTSAQYGLMFVAVGAGVPAAAAAHLIAHALFKALLFLGVGVGMHAVGDPDIRRMRLGRVLPRAGAACAIGALALAAVPPLGGAWTKDAVVAAAFHTSGWVGGLVLAAGFLSAVYATRLYLLAFGRGGEPGPGDGDVLRPPVTEVVVLGVFAAASLVMGLLWLPAGAGVVDAWVGTEIIEAAPWELAVAVALLAVAVAWVAAQVRRTGAADLGLPASARRAVMGWYGMPTATRVVVVNPTLALCRMLARFDDTVIDGTVRAVPWLVRSVSRLLGRWAELGVDGAVMLVAGTASWAARTSSTTDDRRVDGAVEGLATAVGFTGHRARQLQTGLAHQYYLLMTVGVVVIAVTVAIWR